MPFVSLLCWLVSNVAYIVLRHKPGKCYIKGMKETKPQIFLKGLGIQTFVNFKDFFFFLRFIYGLFMPFFGQDSVE